MVIIFSVTLGLLLLGLGFWATGMYYPKDQQPEPIIKLKDAPMLDNGQTLKIMSWNVQFMAGNQHNHFFYDKGNEPFPSLAVNQRILSEIAAVIKKENPDIVLLQEVDNQSRRTHYQNQPQELLKALSDCYPFQSYTYYHKVNWLPLKTMPGRAGMQLCTFSKYPIQQAIRHALAAKVDTDFISQQFQLKQAILETVLPTQSGDTLTVFNTHFSPFAMNTDTPSRQANKASALLKHVEKTSPALLAGDFNALASEQFFKDVHPGERYMHHPNDTTLTPLVEQFQMFPTIADLSGPDQAQYRTYMPAMDHNHTPTTAIDFMFLSNQIKLLNYKVLQEGTSHLSDHFPIIATIQLPDKNH